MNLQPISSAKARPFVFYCAACGKGVRSDQDVDARADLDGASFRAYYCGPCIELGAVGREGGD